ncbi:MAG: hypothetical protein Q9181_006296, partial [Wetmoreana brouardii]
IPKGVRTEDHYENPDARVVADITRFGFSGRLKSALYLTLRTRPNDRKGGEKLINRVLDYKEQWGGPKVKLEPWALKG